MLSGFFVSCKKNKEQKAFREVISMLNSVRYEKKEFYEYEKVRISKEIEKEINVISHNSFKLFFSYKSILYIENGTNILPSEIFKRMMVQNKCFEYAHRIIPMDTFFSYEPEKIKECICVMDRSRSYKIIYEERFTPKELKINIFEIITKTLNMKVDLTNPYYLVIVQGFKTSVGMSVLVNENINFNFSRDQLNKK